MRIVSVMSNTLLRPGPQEFNERFNSDNTDFFAESVKSGSFFSDENPDAPVWIGWTGDRVVEVVGGTDQTKGN
jgi:hypothetical protein